MESGSLFKLAKNFFVGKARDLKDEHIFHKVSLITIFAWVGLGSDGLSSSCYGPEEAFKALGHHAVLAPLVAIAAITTIFIICASYSQIIELFQTGGGGYLVASQLLSPSFGVVSGCALLVDYVLTIAISISSGTDALFSLLPMKFLSFKLFVALGATIFLIIANLRGIRESVILWVPIFFIFLSTHLAAILFSIGTHVPQLPVIVVDIGKDWKIAHSQLGLMGVFILLIRAYSVGAGTYTGIEAVSNGLPILREPRVATGKRTMAYMGVSLAVTVSGLLVAYLLYHVQPQNGKTLNAVLFETLTASWPNSVKLIFLMSAMVSAAALLFIAAQTGFLDGPRVLSNMALDRWFPTRFATLSDRLVTQNGIMLMGFSAIIVLLATRGDVGLLVVLYSINVFITFTLSQLGMIRHWWSSRKKMKGWKRRLFVNTIGCCLTAFILIMLVIMKFWQGGWATLLVTGMLIVLAYLIRNHYRNVSKNLARLDVMAKQFEENAPKQESANTPAAICDASAKTAVVFVNGFNGLGVHTVLSIMRNFPGVFKNFIFIHVGMVDAGNFKGVDQIESLKAHIYNEVNRYVKCMRQLGFNSEAYTEIGTDIVETTLKLATVVAKRFENSIFFGGQLVFEQESFITRFLHNYVAFALQRKLFRNGTPFFVLPIRA